MKGASFSHTSQVPSARASAYSRTAEDRLYRLVVVVELETSSRFGFSEDSLSACLRSLCSFGRLVGGDSPVGLVRPVELSGSVWVSVSFVSVVGVPDEVPPAEVVSVPPSESSLLVDVCSVIGVSLSEF